MVEVMGDLFVLGGQSDVGGVLELQTSIHRLHCSSGEFAWTTLNQKLKVARDSFVAIPVNDFIANCTN